jgi:hypothetical protein
MAYIKRTIEAENFTLNSEGLYEATILSSVHGYGSQYHMARALLMDENENWHNTITPYEILANGDFKLFVNEPGIYRVTLVQD